MLHTILLMMAMGSIGADAYTTHQFSELPHAYENNPIASPFVMHGTALQVGYFGASAGTFLYVDHRVMRHHRKLGILMDIGVIGFESCMAAHNVSHTRYPLHP